MTVNKGGRPSGEKTRCSGVWTEAKYRSFIKSTLRQATRKWKPIQDCLNAARVRRGFYLCACCGQEVPATTIVTLKNGKTKRMKNIVADHVVPVVSELESNPSWDSIIESMFTELDNLQALCYHCHAEVKCIEEAARRKECRGMEARHPNEYKCWVNMVSRCNNPKATGYEYYGGRGITVCEEWLDNIDHFVKDLGVRPSKAHSIDRIDVDAGYTPDNCRWATPKEQARNTRANHSVSYYGEEHCISEWGELLGVLPNTILYRIRRGWSIGEALGYEVHTVEPTATLQESDVEYISSELASGKTQTQLGREFGLHPSVVSRFVKKHGVKCAEETAIQAERKRQEKADA